MPKYFQRSYSGFWKTFCRGQWEAGGWSLNRILTFLGRFDAFLQFLISVSVILKLLLLEALLSQTAHTRCTFPLSLTQSASDGKHKKVKSVTPPQCLIEGCFHTSSLHKDSFAWHSDGLWHFFSINVKWLFGDFNDNYQYWHCDYIWLHLGWKFKNRLKNEDTWLLPSVLTRWNPVFENSGLNWSQCLADLF